MDDFLKGIGSLYWWLSVVFVGILINLVSAYLKPRIDSSLLRSSSWWRKRSAARLAKREDAIQRIVNSPHDEVMLYLNELRSHAKTTEALAASLISFLVGIFAFLLAAFAHQEHVNILGYVSLVLAGIFAIIAAYNTGLGTKLRIMVGFVRLRQDTLQKERAKDTSKRHSS